MHPLNLIVTTVAPTVLSGRHLTHLLPDAKTVAKLLYHCPSHSTAQLPQTLGETVPSNRGTSVVVSAARRGA